MKKRLTKSRRVKVHADRAEDGDTLNDKEYNEDSQVHSPKVDENAYGKGTDTEKPEDKVASSPKVPMKEPAANSDEALAQPLPYVVDSGAAIEKVESLLDKIEESRPDLKNDVAKLREGVENLERKAHGEDYEEHETNEETGDVIPGGEGEEAAPTFSPGDRVEVEAEGETFNGSLEDQNEDGTWEILTDKNVKLSSVPENSIKPISEETHMTLPASKKSRSNMLKAKTRKKKVEAEQKTTELMVSTEHHFTEDSREDPYAGLPQDSGKMSRRPGKGQRMKELSTSSTHNYSKADGKPVYEKGSGAAKDDQAGRKPHGGDGGQKMKELSTTSFDNQTPNSGAPAYKTAKTATPGQLGMFGGSRQRRTVRGMESVTIEPNWPNMVKYLHQVNDIEFWENAVKNKEDGWYAAVGARHPNKTIADMAKASPGYQEGAGAVGLDGLTTEQAKSENATMRKEVGDADDTREAEGEDMHQGVEGKKLIATQALADSLKSYYIKSSARRTVKQTVGAGEKSSMSAKVRADLIARAKIANKKKIAAAKAAATPNVQASAFDDIEELDLGGGWAARRKKGSEKKEAPEAKAAPKAEPKPGDDSLDEAPVGDSPIPAKGSKPGMPDLAPASQKLKAAGENPFAKEGDDDKAEKKDDKKSDKKEAKGDDKKSDKKDAGPTIEVVDPDGKVVESYPDAFGDDTVTIIKLMRQLHDIKDEKDGGKKESKKDDKKSDDKDDDKAEKKEAKSDDEDSISDKPKALPNVKPSKKEDEELAAAEKYMKQRVEMIRGLVAGYMEKGYIVADQKDIDQILETRKVTTIRANKKFVKPISLDAAMDAAIEKAADRKFHEFLAMPDVELLKVQASLPHLRKKVAPVEVRASQEGLSPLAGITVSAELSDGGGFSLGDAFAGFKG